MISTSPSGSLSSTFCFKSIRQPLAEYLRLRPTESISAYGPQGEGGGTLEGLRPSNSSPAEDGFKAQVFNCNPDYFPPLYAVSTLMYTYMEG